MLSYAVAEAVETVAPWGDSPRVFYAALADLGLLVGTLLLALATAGRRTGGSSGSSGSTVLPARLEALAYLLTAIVLAVPLVISAANSLTAAASGLGGPPLVLEILAGVSLTVSLGLILARRIALGLAVSCSLAILLTATALIAAR